MGFIFGIRIGEALVSGRGKEDIAKRGDKAEAVGDFSEDSVRGKGDLLPVLLGGDIPAERSKAPLLSRRTWGPSFPIGTSFLTVVIFTPVFCFGSLTRDGTLGRGGAFISMRRGSFL